MKRILSVLLAASLLLTSCHKAIWEKLNDHEARIAALEAFCNQLNTNILSLQSIVDVIYARDYVKDVVPITENGEVIGYAITFANSSPVTLYNGKNGEEGHTPTIGIKSEDGLWYWTMDGQWILDADGNRVRADGSGIPPKLKIEDDCWWVSYDNGQNWANLGPAVGEKGEPGDSMFQEIRQDDHYVYLVLADGEVIQLFKGGLTWVYV